MRRPGKGTLCAMAIVALAFAIFIYLQFPDQEIDISRETTYFTEPLLENGNVDYFEALNRLTGEGVTSENNAWVTLLETFEFTDLSEIELAEDYKRELGVDLSKGTRRLQSLEDQYTQKHSIDDRNNIVLDRYQQDLDLIEAPWKSADFPRWAELLESHNEALDLFAEAVTRPRMFIPVTLGGLPKEDSLLLATFLPHVNFFRSTASDIGKRAMNRLGEGDVAGAIEDIKTIRLLARLVYQSPFLVGQLVANAIDGIAQSAETELLISRHATAEQLSEHMAFLRQPQPHRFTFAQSIGVVERVTMLDASQAIFRGSLNLSSAGGSGAHDGWGILMMRTADFNSALIELNRQYDQMQDIVNEPNPRKRIQRMQEWEESMEAQENSLYRWRTAFTAMAGGPRSRGKIMGTILTTYLAAAILQVNTAELGSSTANTLIEIAIADELYKAGKGEYAESLADLTPKWFAEVPQDWFGTGELTYRRTSDGFIVYSVGRDGVNNGGKDEYGDQGRQQGSDQILQIGKAGE